MLDFVHSYCVGDILLCLNCSVWFEHEEPFTLKGAVGWILLQCMRLHFARLPLLPGPY
jgi:hypothetical protein